MQIAIFSDFHNSVDFNSLQKALSTVPALDAAFTLGDISVSELLRIKELIPDIPIFGILGNHDSLDVLDKAGIPDIHGKIVDVNGIRFAGFSGSVKYKNGPYAMFSQRESLNIAKSLPEADVLLSHDKAYQGKNKIFWSEYSKYPHEGLVGISLYLRKKSPLLHIHGHIHENERYLNQKIDTISVYGASLIFLTEDNLELYHLYLK